MSSNSAMRDIIVIMFNALFTVVVILFKSEADFNILITVGIVFQV